MYDPSTLYRLTYPHYLYTYVFRTSCHYTQSCVLCLYVRIYVYRYTSDHLLYVYTVSLVPPAIRSNSIVRSTCNCQLLSELVVWSGEGCMLFALGVDNAFSLLPHAASSSSVTPNVTDISEDQTVTSPAPVSFNCTVDSYPPSSITWLHNGAEVLADSTRVTINTVQVDNRTQESTLTLLNTTSVDIGTYTCSAVNDEGSTSTTSELLVLGELALLHLAVKCSYSSYALVLLTSPLSIGCRYVHLYPFFSLLSCS